MRERKYRAWDKKRKEWYRESCDMLTYYGFALFGECTLIEPPHCTDLPNLEITEFTGLKDKNGVEIYEGDIVTAVTCKGDGVEDLLGKIIYEDAEYLVEQNSGYFPLCSFHVVDRGSFEVIGNVYESPELLEADK